MALPSTHAALDLSRRPSRLFEGVQLFFVFPFVVLALSSCFYAWHLLQRAVPAELIESREIAWSETCQAAAHGLGLEAENSAVAAREGQSCVSAWFSTNARSIFIEYSGFPNFNKQSGIFLEYRRAGDDAITSTRLQLPAVFPAQAWKRSIVSIPDSGSSLRLRLVSPSAVPFVAIRRPLEFSSFSPTLAALRERIAEPSTATALTLGTTAALVLVLLYSMSSSRGLFVPALLLSGVSLFRFDLFFRHDEWRMLERLQEGGIVAVLQPHNEHFIPLFMLLYYAETLLFGASYGLYVLMSLVLHALNAVLLAAILERLAVALPLAPTSGRHAARLLALIYVLSAVHLESIQWVAVQGQLLALFFSFASIRLLLAEESRYRSLSALLVLAAGLSFASGLVAGVHAICFALCFLKKRRLGQTLRLSAATLLAAALYLQAGVASSPGVHRLMDTPEYLLEVLRYLSAALFGGSIWRGLGLSRATSLPALEKDAAQLTAGVATSIPQLALLLLPLVLGVVLLPWRAMRSSLALRISSFGLFWLVSSLLLPAVGRAMLGAHHGMTLRYHSYSVVGLAFLLFPLLALALDHLKRVSAGPAAVRMPARALQSLGLLLLFLFCKQQLLFSSEVRIFWREGYSLKQWYERVAAHQYIRNEQQTQALLLSYSDRGIRAKPPLPAEVLQRLVPAKTQSTNEVD